MQSHSSASWLVSRGQTFQEREGLVTIGSIPWTAPECWRDRKPLIYHFIRKGVGPSLAEKYSHPVPHVCSNLWCCSAVEVKSSQGSVVACALWLVVAHAYPECMRIRDVILMAFHCNAATTSWCVKKKPPHFIASADINMLDSRGVFAFCAEGFAL